MIINSGTLQTLYRAFNASFREGFGQAPADHEPIRMETRSETSEEEYGWLGQWPGLREWVGERVLRGIAEHAYTIRNRKFESTIGVRRDHIEDDRVGVYAPLFSELGRAAGAHPCEMVFEALNKGHENLCYDGQYFFDTDHATPNGSVSNYAAGASHPWFLVDCSRMIKPIVFQKRRDYHMQHMDAQNDEAVFMRDEYRYGVDARVNVGYGLWQLAYGSRAALDATAYEAARTVLMKMVGDEGRPLGIKPTHLVVGPDLEHEAMEIVTAERLANGATNVWRGTAQVICTSWITS